MTRLLQIMALLTSLLTQAEWVCGQRHIVFSPDIASLQVVAGVRWQQMPIITLGGREAIHISFDELSHEYRRFTYSVTHLEYDWTPSDGLFSSDYLAGFQDGLTIENYEQSINTLQDYTHYSLTLPNDQCRFTMSGNYRVDIRDDNDGDRLMLSVFFLVSEDRINAGLSYTPDTDIDLRKEHQQVRVAFDYSALRATDPRRQIKGYVLQNYRWDNAVTLPSPDFFSQRMMEWQHCRELIFPAGNEYHKFEILDIHRNSLNVENNVWDGEQWHTVLWPDYERRSYAYDETPKGAFLIRNTDNYENNVTSEYTNVHFLLRSEPLPYRLFVNGMWTNGRFLPRYEMHYDIDRRLYEAVVPLKYGYYSYQYLMLKDEDVVEGDVEYNENVGCNLVTPLVPPTEGSFFQTRNNYTALIYYRSNTDRADRLVGVAY